MRFRQILPLLLAAVLVSCGGDDDNGIKPDTTPPTVTSTAPGHLEEDVHPNSAISATFSELVDTMTVNDTTFQILGGISGTITYIDRMAIFIPDSSLTPGQEYFAAITTGVTDLAGNAMIENYVWSFTVSQVFLTDGADYFPMANGDTWYYTDSLMQSVVREVSGDTIIESISCKRILQNGETTEAWSVDSSGFHVHLLDKILWFEPPLKIPFDLAYDAPYYYQSEVFWYSGDTLFQAEEPISGNLKFKGYVTYDTPITGIHFDDVIKFFYIPDGYYEYYARGVGLLDNEDLVLDSAFVGGVWYR